MVVAEWFGVFDNGAFPSVYQAVLCKVCLESRKRLFNRETDDDAESREVVDLYLSRAFEAVHPKSFFPIKELFVRLTNYKASPPWTRETVEKLLELRGAMRKSSVVKMPSTTTFNVEETTQ